LRAVFASRNRHKAEQVSILLPDVELVMLDEVAPDLVLHEPHETFEANALAKARVTVRATGLPAIADDSGLEVDAIGGRPGVLSARYAGEGATDEDNNRKLVSEVAEVHEERRTCRYRCVAALAFPEGTELIAEGICEGRVVLEGRGELGFGYDPHVVPEGETRTMGEIPLEEKLRFSHRGRAFRALAERLRVLTTSRAAVQLRTERMRGSIREEELEPDPIEQFASWLKDALDAAVSEPNAMILATATPEGKPSARTVLLRGFDDQGFVFFTNYESRKGGELSANPHAALVFYWAELERQVCITGDTHRLTHDESERYFRSRPRGHQLGAWASEQSRPISDRRALERKVDEVATRFRDREIPLPPFWGGFRVEPISIEFWQGRPDRLHDRFLYARSEDGEWLMQRLAP
jgi:pyridoxamine 5'-phosphate oxidase